MWRPTVRARMPKPTHPSIPKGFTFLSILLGVDLVVVCGLLYALLFHAPGSSPPVSLPDALVKLRNVFVMEVRDGTGVLEASPRDLRREGFLVDDPELADQWIQRMRRELPYLQGPLPEHPVDRVQLLIRRFSRNGGGDCGAFDDLSHLLERINEGEGHGCCSDHTEALIAIGRAAHLQVREVSNTRHVFAELYLPKEERWVWVDPQYALLAKGPDGRYLSLLDLREAYLDGRTFSFEFFGTKHHVLNGNEPGFLAYYDEPSDFSDVWIDWGNNVFEADRLYSSLPLPRPALQLVGLATGDIPHKVMVRDANSVQAHSLAYQQALGMGAVAGLAVAAMIVAVGAVELIRWKHGRGYGPR